MGTALGALDRSESARVNCAHWRLEACKIVNNKNDLKAEKTLCNCTFVHIEVIRVDSVPEVVEELNDQPILKIICTDGMESTRLNFVHLHQGGRRGVLHCSSAPGYIRTTSPLPFRQHSGLL